MRLRTSILGKIGRAVSRALMAIVNPRRRRMFLREIAFRIAGRATSTVAAESDGLQFFVSTGDRGVGMTLFMGEDVERETLQRAIDEMRAVGRTDPGPTFVDIGANIGTSTVNAIAKFGFARAVCFEPLPENLVLLRQNLKANGMEALAEVHEVALSDREGTAEFEIAPGNLSDARVRPSARGTGSLGEEQWPTVEVRLETWDRLAARGAFAEVGMVWMDAQGHEGHILSGAGEFRRRPVPLVTEFWPYGLRRAGGLELMVDLLRETFSEFVDLGASEGRRPVSELHLLPDRYTDTSDTDLLLLP